MNCISRNSGTFYTSVVCLILQSIDSSLFFRSTFEKVRNLFLSSMKFYQMHLWHREIWNGWSKKSSPSNWYTGLFFPYIPHDTFRVLTANGSGLLETRCQTVLTQSTQFVIGPRRPRLHKHACWISRQGVREWENNLLTWVRDGHFTSRLSPNTRLCSRNCEIRAAAGGVPYTGKQRVWKAFWLVTPPGGDACTACCPSFLGWESVERRGRREEGGGRSNPSLDCSSPPHGVDAHCLTTLTDITSNILPNSR